MIKSVLSAIGLTLVLIMFVNFLWLKKHREPVSLDSLTQVGHVVERSRELPAEMKAEFLRLTTKGHK